jgi:hypothetical protein
MKSALFLLAALLSSPAFAGDSDTVRCEWKAEDTRGFPEVPWKDLKLGSRDNRFNIFLGDLNLLVETTSDHEMVLLTIAAEQTVIDSDTANGTETAKVSAENPKGKGKVEVRCRKLQKPLGETAIG